MLKTSLTLAITIFAVFLFIPTITFAYLDPGSGSYLIQIIVASVAGAGYLLKVNWEKVKGILFKRKTGKTNGKKNAGK